MNAVGWIEKLKLSPHPEGGYFREVYRSADDIVQSALPQRFPDKRAFSTAIYYLLSQDDFSAFHRIKSDEIWHFYAGGALDIHLIHPLGDYECLHLGHKDGSFPLQVVPFGCWFAASPAKGTDFTLVGCTVSPGFDFADFEMAGRETMIDQFPQHSELIKAYTRV